MGQPVVRCRRTMQHSSKANAVEDQKVHCTRDVKNGTKHGRLFSVRRTRICCTQLRYWLLGCGPPRCATIGGVNVRMSIFLTGPQVLTWTKVTRAEVFRKLQQVCLVNDNGLLQFSLNALGTDNIVRYFIRIRNFDRV